MTFLKYKVDYVKSLLFIGLVLSMTLCIQILHSQKASAAYDGGRLIDNGLFLDATAMDAAQIQSFLASKGGGIASKNFNLNCDVAGAQAKQAYLLLGAPCGQDIAASQIIYYSSRVYGLNPKVILSTLQKEQSLITSPNPTDRQYAQAMGYSCPTSGSCDSASNFFWQIDNATWVLRYHFERARGNMTWWSPSSSWTCGTEKAYYKANLYPGQNVNFYDEDSVYYRTHFIGNAATSSLYCYTPHAYNNPSGLYGLPAYGSTGRYYTGSYNFVKFYEIWFGSTIGQPNFKDSPASTSWGNGRIDNFIRGEDNALWQKTYDMADGGWKNWSKIGGSMASAPTVTTWGAGRLDVFSTSPSGELQHIWYGAGEWQGWESLGKP